MFRGTNSNYTLTEIVAYRSHEEMSADAGKDSAREIREYFIPHFSDWKKHDEYQKASFPTGSESSIGFAQDKFWAVDEGFEGGGERQKLEIRK